MRDLTVLVPCTHPGDTPPGDPVVAIEVRWEPTPPGLSPSAAAHVEARWAAYVAAAQAGGKDLFNGPVTRLLAADRVDGRVVLRLGPADYKTFVVTCLRDRAWFAAHAPDAPTPALGNSVLLTHRGEAFLGRRSPRVSAYAGRLHLVGGVLDVLGTPEFPPTVDGLVGHLRKELEEEVGLTAGDLDSAAGPRFLGVVRDDFLAQPEAIWQWEIPLPLATVGARLQAPEHTAWLAVGRERVSAASWQEMTPAARYAWHQWSGRPSP
jgi:8-oxo-dGTP pyrophosphatase MutT (NUDIX family)